VAGVHLAATEQRRECHAAAAEAIRPAPDDSIFGQRFIAHGAQQRIVGLAPAAHFRLGQGNAQFNSPMMHGNDRPFNRFATCSSEYRPTAVFIVFHARYFCCRREFPTGAAGSYTGDTSIQFSCNLCVGSDAQQALFRFCPERIKPAELEFPSVNASAERPPNFDRFCGQLHGLALYPKGRFPPGSRY